MVSEARDLLYAGVTNLGLSLQNLPNDRNLANKAYKKTEVKRKQAKPSQQIEGELNMATKRTKLHQ